MATPTDIAAALINSVGFDEATRLVRDVPGDNLISKRLVEWVGRWCAMDIIETMAPPHKAKKIADAAATAERVGKRAGSVRDAVACLSERIVQFEDYLGGLHGRVEVAVEELGLRLWFHRACSDKSDRGNNRGKKWVLEVRNKDDETWRTLATAGLLEKMAAVQMFPGLLEQMLHNQALLLERVEAATKAYDEFFAGLGRSPKPA